MPSNARALVAIVLTLTALVSLPACAKRARVRPVEMGPVSTGAGTLEAVRRQLEGTWHLVSAEVVAPDGTARAVKGQALLTYDAYGNFTLKGSYEEPSLGADAAAAINFAGRAAIDVQKHELHLLDLRQPDGDFEKLPPEMVASRTRQYEFVGDTLKMTIRNAKGAVTAVNIWKK